MLFIIRNNFCLQNKVESNKFVNYMCEDVFSVLLSLPKNVQDGGSDAHLELLKLAAELSKHCSTLEDPDAKLQQVYTLLLVRTFYDCIIF